MPLLSANIVLCETALAEATRVTSAIRIIDVITLAPVNNVARFFSLVFLSCSSLDLSPHMLKVRLTTSQGAPVTEAPDYQFYYGFHVDPNGPGAFNLKTEFNVDTSNLMLPTTCLVYADLDGQNVARTTIRLRRK